MAGIHTEHEVNDWTTNIRDHPRRTESEEFRHAKTVMHKILAQIRQNDSSSLIATMAGSGSVQAHHAGSLFVYCDESWTLFLNSAGVEWSAQWSADPAHVDLLRQAAEKLYKRFPETLDELEKLGYGEAREILSTSITNHPGVARWTDSLFNACVPLSPPLHQAFPGHHQVAGWHHVPKSIWDQQLTKRDDFELWVIDPRDKQPAAVAPVDHHGSGDGRVEVMWCPRGSALHTDQLEHAAAGKPHILHDDHPLAQQAFAKQAA